MEKKLPRDDEKKGNSRWTAPRENKECVIDFVKSVKSVAPYAKSK